MIRKFLLDSKSYGPKHGWIRIKKKIRILSPVKLDSISVPGHLNLPPDSS